MGYCALGIGTWRTGRVLPPGRRTLVSGIAHGCGCVVTTVCPGRPRNTKAGRGLPPLGSKPKPTPGVAGDLPKGKSFHFAEGGFAVCSEGSKCHVGPVATLLLFRVTPGRSGPPCADSPGRTASGLRSSTTAGGLSGSWVCEGGRGAWANPGALRNRTSMKYRIVPPPVILVLFARPGAYRGPPIQSPYPPLTVCGSISVARVSIPSRVSKPSRDRQGAALGKQAPPRRRTYVAL
jgi:hypothetical protein